MASATFDDARALATAHERAAVPWYIWCSALAVTSAKRFPELPDLPTVAETYPGFDFAGWWMLSAPTGTPANIIARMNHEMDATLRDEKVVARMRGMGFLSFGAGSVKDAQDYVNAQHAAWGTLVKEIGVKPE